MEADRLEAVGGQLLAVGRKSPVNRQLEKANCQHMLAEELTAGSVALSITTET